MRDSSRGEPRPARPWAAACLFLAATQVVLVAVAQDDEETEAPGLLVSFTVPGETAPRARRIAADLQGDWSTAAPDPRVPVDNFQARWEGLLLIQSPGLHQFSTRSDGDVLLRVAGRVVLDGPPDSRRSVPLDLPAGMTPVVLEYRHARGAARLAIDWKGPTFDREPLPARLLFHDPAKTGGLDRFEEGRRLADRLGCANCHAVLDLPKHPNLGPPLSEAGRTLAVPWLDQWLADPTAVRATTPMPAFGRGFSAQEAADLRTFLTEPASRPLALTGEIRMALNVADPERGRILFRSRGCLGCHVTTAPAPAERTAPELSDLPRKRSRSALAVYLEHPRSGKPVGRHRADLRLIADESAHLAAFLVPAAIEPVPGHSVLKGDARAGRRLAENARCASCHAIPGLKAPRAELPLGSGAKPDAGCLADAPANNLVPRFALTNDQRRALREFVAGIPRAPSPTAPLTRADDTIRRLNCLGCHTRDGQGGQTLGTQVAALLASDPALGGLKGTLTPPNLTAVGDKLRPEYLALAVRGAAPTARPWLSVRMPAFAFEPDEADAIASAFQAHDRVQLNSDPAEATARPSAAAREEAIQLIGQRGFGCVSCHVLAGRIPPGGEPETLGPDLALAHRRMTGRYFQRWIANPQRIIAGTPMPQFLKPIATRPGTLEDQLETIWRLLGSPDVAEVSATATREVLKRQGDRALVVRDMVILPDAPQTPFIPRALAIGLKNDHSLLFDTDRLTWLSWWHRGFLSRTKSGRLWEWHPEGERLWIALNRQAPIAFLAPDGTVTLPREVRERFGSFSELDFDQSDVVLTYRLNGPSDTEVEVRERLHPQGDGWDRLVEVSHVPSGYEPILVEHPPGGSWTWTVGKTRVSAEVVAPQHPFPSLAGDPAARLLPIPRTESGFRTRLHLSVAPLPRRNEVAK